MTTKKLSRSKIELLVIIHNSVEMIVRNLGTTNSAGKILRAYSLVKSGYAKTTCAPNDAVFLNATIQLTDKGKKVIDAYLSLTDDAKKYVFNSYVHVDFYSFIVAVRMLFEGCHIVRVVGATGLERKAISYHAYRIWGVNARKKFAKSTQ